MSNFKYHIQIAQERRASTPEKPRVLATAIDASYWVPNEETGKSPDFVRVEQPIQLYSLSDGVNWQPDKDTVFDANILMVEQLHESGLYVEVIYGDNSECKGRYMAWPEYRSEKEYIIGEEAKRLQAEESEILRKEQEELLRKQYETDHPDNFI